MLCKWLSNTMASEPYTRDTELPFFETSPSRPSSSLSMVRRCDKDAQSIDKFPDAEMAANSLALRSLFPHRKIQGRGTEMGGSARWTYVVTYRDSLWCCCRWSGWILDYALGCYEDFVADPGEEAQGMLYTELIFYRKSEYQEQYLMIVLFYVY